MFSNRSFDKCCNFGEIVSKFAFFRRNLHIARSNTFSSFNGTLRHKSPPNSYQTSMSLRLLSGFKETAIEAEYVFKDTRVAFPIAINTFQDANEALKLLATSSNYTEGSVKNALNKIIPMMTASDLNVIYLGRLGSCDHVINAIKTHLTSKPTLNDIISQCLAITYFFLKESIDVGGSAANRKIFEKNDCISTAMACLRNSETRQHPGVMIHAAYVLQECARHFQTQFHAQNGLEEVLGLLPEFGGDPLLANIVFHTINNATSTESAATADAYRNQLILRSYSSALFHLLEKHINEVGIVDAIGHSLIFFTDSIDPQIERNVLDSLEKSGLHPLLLLALDTHNKNEFVANTLCTVIAILLQSDPRNVAIFTALGVCERLTDVYFHFIAPSGMEDSKAECQSDIKEVIERACEIIRETNPASAYRLDKYWNKIEESIRDTAGTK